MLARFRAKKQQILDKLLVPDDEYEDASPKGAVDEDIRSLVTTINNIPGFVTTSSCSGRIAVFVEGPQKSTHLYTDEHDPENGLTASTGGKGGGKWLFTSHAPLDTTTLSAEATLFERMGLQRDAQISFPDAEERPQFVHFKFEPMVSAKFSSSCARTETYGG